MPEFSFEEINLICIYDPGNRAGTIYELREMMNCLMPDEEDLKALTQGVIDKLEAMTDAEYEALSEELAPDCVESFDCEATAYCSPLFGFSDFTDPDADIE